MLRGGFSMGYNRPGTSDFTGAIDDNPGVSLIGEPHARASAISARRARSSCATRADVGPPANMPSTTGLPDDRRHHRRHHRVRAEAAGAVRDDVDRRLAAQARSQHGRRGALRRHALAPVLADLQLQRDQHRRERLPERVPRSRSRTSSANIAADRGNTFAYTGAPGTSPLPIFLAHFNAIGASGAGNTANYTGTNWTNATFLGFLAKFNPSRTASPTPATDRLIGNATFRNNALTAGLPANFWQANPDLIGGANIVGNGGATTTTRCSSSSASASRTDCSSRRTTSTASRTAQRATRCATRASACRTPAPSAASRMRSAPTGSTSCRSARAGASPAVPDRGSIS